MRSPRLIAIFSFGICLFGSLTVAPAFAQFRNVAVGQTAKARIGMQFTTNSGLYPIGCSGEKTGQLTISPIPLPKDASAAAIAAAKDDAADFQVNGDKDGISGKTCGRDEILYAEITFTPHRVGLEKANLSVKVTANPPQFQGYFQPPSTTLEGKGVAAIQQPIAKTPLEPEAGPRAGDIVLYQLGGVYNHVAVVIEVKPHTLVITKVRSKWGPEATYDHDPNETLAYGKAWTVWRRKRQNNNPPESRNALDVGSFEGTSCFKTDKDRSIIPGSGGAGSFDALPPAHSEFLALIKAAGLTSVHEVYPPSLQYDCRGFVWGRKQRPIADTFLFWNQVVEILEDGYTIVNALDTSGQAH